MDNQRQDLCSGGAYSVAFTGTQLKILETDSKVSLLFFCYPENRNKQCFHSHPAGIDP